MIVLNLTLNLLLKSLITYAAFYDLITLIVFIQKFKSQKVTDLIFDDFSLCSIDAVCHALDYLSSLLYFISISILIVFYSYFDKNFRSRKKIVFKRFFDSVFKLLTNLKTYLKKILIN